MRTLASRIKSRPFRKESFAGFILDRARDTHLDGRYVEKLSIQEKVTSPFGEEQVFDRTIYRELKFCLFSDFPNMELWDAPRSTTGYISQLVELNNFEVTITPLSVDLLQWVAGIEANIQTKVTIDSLQISGLEVESGVTARILIVGDRDVKDAAQKIARGKKFELDRVHLRFASPSDPVRIHLSRTGTMKVEEAFIDDYLEPVRRALPRPRAE
jgi:hypothetical protein